MGDEVNGNAEANFPERRLEELRKSVDGGAARPLPWRLNQLDGLLRFVADHETAMLSALKADLGRCSAEAHVADISMVRSEITLMRRNLRRWLRPRPVRTPLAAQPGKSWIEQEPFGVALILGTWNYPFQQILIPLAGALAAGAVPELGGAAGGGHRNYRRPGDGGTIARIAIRQNLLHRPEPCGQVGDDGGSGSLDARNA